LQEHDAIPAGEVSRAALDRHRHLERWDRDRQAKAFAMERKWKPIAPVAWCMSALAALDLPCAHIMPLTRRDN
jgi:hypothetical protein